MSTRKGASRTPRSIVHLHGTQTLCYFGKSSTASSWHYICVVCRYMSSRNSSAQSRNVSRSSIGRWLQRKQRRLGPATRAATTFAYHSRPGKPVEYTCSLTHRPVAIPRTNTDGHSLPTLYDRVCTPQRPSAATQRASTDPWNFRDCREMSDYERRHPRLLAPPRRRTREPCLAALHLVLQKDIRHCYRESTLSVS